MATQTNLVMKRELKQAIIEHALEGAREKGYEILGWLTGFSTEDTVYILDAVPCTKYKRQSRYAAEAHPTQEAKLASGFPRNVGIVGLYHSHPFKMDHESAEFRRLHGVSELFHSGIDDAMLKSRSSRMKNYVSIVTDIDTISCYVMHKKKPRKIKENLVVDINFKDHMRPVTSKLQLVYEHEFKPGPVLASMIRSMEYGLVTRMDMNLKEEDIAIQQGPVGNVLRLLPFEKGDRGDSNTKDNFFRIIPSESHIKIKAVMNLAPTIYVHKGYIDLDKAAESLVNEITDYIVFLTWSQIDYSDFEKHLSSDIKELEIHLGRLTTKYDEESGIPKKVYTKPKRRMTIKKN
jgi:hypothetical protein